MSQTAKTGTFLVTHADAESAVLKDVDDGQVHTLSSNPDVEVDDVLEGTLSPEPPLEVAWTVEEIDARRSLAVERVDLEPTRQAFDLAADRAVGDVARAERAGEGELHALPTPDGEADEAAAEVAADEATRTRAARLDAERVEIRTGDDVVSVRYLP